MSDMNLWHDVLDKSDAIALATSVDGAPNVRIVNYCFDRNRPGILYFASDRTNRKVEEFRQNNRVALTTVPADGEAVPHMRSLDARVVPSERSIREMAPLFSAKIPGYDETIAAIGDSLDVFEIHVSKALAVLDFETVLTIEFP